MSIRAVQIKKSDDTKSAKDVGEWEFSHIADGSTKQKQSGKFL